MSIEHKKIFYIIKYALIAYILHVNASLLARLKNPHEHVQYTMIDLEHEINMHDKNYQGKKALPNVSDTTAQSVEKTPQYYEGSSHSSHKNTAKGTYFQRETVISNAEFYFYDGDKWPTIKLFTSAAASFQQRSLPTFSIKYKKKTWPSYFPLKFISKVESELDSALLPWKQTKLTPSNNNKSTNKLGNNSEFTSVSVRRKRYEVKASCYMCGLNERGIPLKTECHNAFESNNERYRKLQRRFKVKCIHDSKSRRSKNVNYGPNFIGGCFKRYLDVGMVYDERGCRTEEPMMGKSYASRRLANLEKMLSDIDEGCVFSPLASLTPFSRAVSLYVRYHVCVCKGNFCNQASNSFQMIFLKPVFLMFLHIKFL